MSRRTLLMLSAGALCALGIGTAVVLANSGDADELNNSTSNTVITTNSTSTTFKGSSSAIFGVTCKKAGGGIETKEAKQKLPYTAPVNKPALFYKECNNGATVTVTGGTEMTLESGNANRTTDPDPAYDGADENDADTATLRVPSTSSIVISLSGCTVTISGQSFTGDASAEDKSATLDQASLVFNNVPVPYTASGSSCGLDGISTPSGTGVFTATYPVTPSTLDDLS